MPKDGGALVWRSGQAIWRSWWSYKIGWDGLKKFLDVTSMLFAFCTNSIVSNGNNKIMGTTRLKCSLGVLSVKKMDLLHALFADRNWPSPCYCYIPHLHVLCTFFLCLQLLAACVFGNNLLNHAKRNTHIQCPIYLQYDYQVKRIYEKLKFEFYKCILLYVTKHYSC